MKRPLDVENETATPKRAKAKGEDAVAVKKKQEKPAPSDPEGEKDQGGSRSSKRKRKRKIFREISEQMEFYFSDANLSKSKFMQNLLEGDGIIDLSVFLKFNKLAEILKTTYGRLETKDLYDTLSKVDSEVIEVRESEESDHFFIKRKTKFKMACKEDIEARTIYVEQIPHNMNHDILKRHFSQYGTVSYISLPKYKFNQRLKGFGFIEFEGVESIAKVLEAYGALEEKKEEVKPDELQSIKAYNKEQAVEQGIMDQDDHNESSSSTSEGEEVEDKVEGQNKNDREPNQGDDNTEEVKGEKGNVNAKDNKLNKKKKRKRNKILSSGSGKSDYDLLLMSTLQIMSKSKWKQLRNAYLNLQRKNMSKAKNRVREWKKERNPSENQELSIEKKTGIEFVPNIIVKFVASKPVEDRLSLKKLISSAFMEPVQYVDIEEGSMEYFVRCSSEDQAEKLAAITKFGVGSVLAGDEEQKYWDRINQQRVQKFLGQVKIPRDKDKLRGKQRLIINLNEISKTRKLFDD